MVEAASPLFAPVIWEGDRFRILDETRLPWKTEYITVTEVGEAIEAVRDMKTRAFGQVLTLLYSAALLARSSEAKDSGELTKQQHNLPMPFRRRDRPSTSKNTPNFSTMH